MQHHGAMKKGVAWLCTLAMLLTFIPGALPAAAAEEAPVFELETQAQEITVPEGSACNGLPELMAAEPTHTKRAATRAYGNASEYKLESKYFIWTSDASQNQSGNGKGALGTDFLVNNISPTLFNGWMDKLDLAYESYLKLVGQTPVGGQKLIFIPADTSWAHVLSGNGTPYIFWNPEVIPEALQEIEASRGEDVCFGIVHELSHLFDIDNHWTFHGEFFANIKMYYMLQDTGFKISLGAGLESGLDRMQRLSEEAMGNFTKDQSGYKIFDAGNAEPPLIAFWPMFDNGNWVKGWDAFQKTFRSYYDPNYVQETLFPDPNGQVQDLLHRLTKFYGSDVTADMSDALKTQINSRYFALPLSGVPTVIQYGGPKGIVTGSGSLTLTFDRAVAPVVGKNIEVFIFRKTYEYAGTTATPVRGSNDFLACSYTLTAEDVPTSTGGGAYQLSVPFSKFSNYLDTILNGPMGGLDDEFGFCEVSVEQGAFTYGNGTGTMSRYWNDTFQRKRFNAVSVLSSTPTERATNVPTSGSLIVKFSQQMDKTKGSITLNNNTLAGNWSEDGRTYIASYSGLSDTMESYTATLTGYQGPDGNAALTSGISFTCGNTFPDNSVAVDISSLEADASGLGWTYTASTKILLLNSDANVKLSGTVADGRHVIVANPATNVRIELAGVSISTADENCSALDMSGAAVVLTLKADTENVLSASGNDSSALRISDGTLELNGTGKLTATSGPSWPGIGGSSGQITIKNGTIIANGGSNAAGIGGSWGQSVTVAIGGGNITATGGSNGAGIGGGSGGAGGTINISGGTISATSGEKGAGIGGGNNGAGGTISISGGDITARSTTNGAGIGGGNTKGGGQITITDGTLHVTGGAWASGIGGGGDGGSGESILIFGGTVTVAAHTHGAGIGGGMRGNGGIITISGGTVTATGSDNAANIGAGFGDGLGVGSAGTITINGGKIAAERIGTPDIGNGGTVTINGGTIISVTGVTTEGIHIAGEGGKVTINGGSIYTDTVTPKPTNKAGLEVGLYILRTNPDTAPGSAVTAGSFNGVSCDSKQVAGSGTPSGYGIYDVQMNVHNMFNPWLPTPPAEGQLISLTVDGVKYESHVTGSNVTLTAPTWAVTPNPTFITFPTADRGYASVTPTTVTVTNTGNQPLDGGLNIFLTGTDAANFTLSAPSLPSMQPNGNATFTVKPVDGLSGQSTPYTANVSIQDNNNMVSASVPLSFTVNPVSTISIAAIPGVTAPVADAKPVTAITETAQYTGTVAWSDSPATFGYGTAYTATITLTPKSGYRLDGVAADFFTVEGATTVTNAASSGVIKATFPATDAAIYTASIDLISHTFPSAVYGYRTQTAQMFTITNTGNQTLTGLTAALAGENFVISTPLSPTSIAPGATATVSVRPIAGLTVETYSGTLNITGNNDISLSATLSFTVNAKTIDIFDIEGVTAPVACKTPVAAITGSDQYTGTVTWSGDPATFGYGTAYTATITLTAKSGYKLDGVAVNSFKIADATTVTNAINSGEIKAVFPATTAATYIASIDLTEKTFDAAAYGYGEQAAQVFTITNTGNQTLTDLTAALAGENFVISTPLSPTSIAPGETATVSVRPKTGLTVNSYSGTLNITGDNNAPVSANLTFAVTPATITGELPSYRHTLLANAAENTATAALKAVANGGSALPSTVALPYAGGTATLGVTWGEAPEGFNVKGGTYTWKGTVTTGTNFNAVAALTATVTVTPVTITAVTATLPSTLTLLKGAVASAQSLTDLGFPAEVNLTFDQEVAPAAVTAHWDTTLAYLQTLAGEVTADTSKDKTVALTTGNFPAWATVGGDLSLPRSAVTIIDKNSIPSANISIDNATITYGQAYLPSASVDTTAYGDCTFIYNGGKALPTDVGVYTLTVKAESTTYVGTTTFTLTIEQATPTITKAPTVSGTLYVNDPLSTISLSGGTASTAGTFAFESPNAVYAEAGAQTVTVVFTPTDGKNFATQTTPISVTVARRQVASVETLTAITDKDYGTAQADLGLPQTVTLTTADGKTFSNVPVSWSGYNGNTLSVQTLTGTLALTAISTAVEQPDQAVTATISVTLVPKTPGAVSYTAKSATYTGQGIGHEISGSIDGVSAIAYSYAGGGYGPTATAPINAGTYTVTATFTMTPGYQQLEPKTVTLTIAPKDLSGFSVQAIPEQTYTGWAITPTIAFTGEALVLDTDYTVACGNNIVAGTATATITGKGNYTGTIPLTFTIGKSDAVMETIISDETPIFGDTLMVTVSNISAAPQKVRSISTVLNTVYLYLAGENTPLAQAEVIGNGATLTYATGDKSLKIGENTLYVAYGGNDNLKEELIGESFTVTLSAKPLTDDMIQAIGSQTYTGSQIKPQPTLVDGLVPLTSGGDYIAAWGENLNAGTGTVEVTGAGNYEGTASATFTIAPMDSKEISAPATVRYNDTAVQTVNIAQAMAAYTLEHDVPTFVLGAVADESGLLTDATTIDVDGLLTYQLAEGLTDANLSQTVTIPVTVTELTNVTTLTITVTVSITDATVVDVDMSGITLESRAYNGEALAHSGAATGTVGGSELYPGDFAYLYTGRDGTDYPETEDAPVNAGKYTLTVVVTEGGFTGSATRDFEITKAPQDAPTDLTAVRPTTDANLDGKIEGLDAAASYEYKHSSAGAYTPVSGGTAIENLTPGTYLVRLAGDDNHHPSGDTPVEVLKYLPTVRIVSVTANGLDAAVTTTELTIALGDDTFTLLPEYITLTGATKGTLSGSGGSYTLAVSDILTNGATVTIGFDSALCIFDPARVETTVHRIVSEQFPEAQFEAAFGMTREALALWHKDEIVLSGQNDWSMGLTVPDIDQNSVTLSKEGGGAAVIYLKKGGTVYETTVSYLLDTVNPVLGTEDIDGVPETWVNAASIVLRPTDVTSGVAGVSVTLNETAVSVQCQADGSYTFTATENGSYAVTMTDTAGNIASETIVVARVDATPPQTSITPLPEGGKWYGETTMTATATDNDGGSGAVTLTATRNGAAIVLNSGKFTAATTGTYVITATDAAGNQATTTFTIYVEPKIDEFVAMVAQLGAESTIEDLLTAQRWYGQQSTTVQSRFDKNNGAKAALARLNSLLESKRQEAAQAVIAAIEQADTIATIVAAQAALDALSPEAKALISTQTKATLAQKNSDAAAGRNMVAVLANAAKPSATYEAKQAAAEAYAKLTDGQTALVSKEAGADENRAAVTADLTAIDSVLAALAAVTQPYTPDAKTKIQAARDSYLALSQARKDAFPRDKKTALDAMSAQLEAAVKAEDAIAALGATPIEQAILAARGSYNALTASEKLLVANGATLDAAYEAMMAQKQGDEKAAAQFATQMAEVMSNPSIKGIEALKEAHGKLTTAAQALVDAERYKALCDDLDAARPVADQLSAIQLASLTSDSRGPIALALEAFTNLNSSRKALVNEAVGDKVTVLRDASNQSEAAELAIHAIERHTDGYIGADCATQGGGHTYESHRASIETAKQAYERLTDTARKLVRGDDKETLNREYAALMNYLEYIDKAESAKSKVEVSGLTEKVQLPAESENNAKTVVSVVMEESKPTVMPAPSTTERTEALSVDVKLVASLYDDVTEGAKPTATEQVQPKEDETVLIKLQIPNGYKNDTLEIWHVKENGGRDRIYDFQLATESDGVYAVFEVGSFSHFVLFAEEDTSAPPAGGGSSCGGAVQVEPPALIVGEHGTATLTPTAPKAGAAVTISVKPDQGYTVDTVTVLDGKGKSVAVTAGAEGTYTFVQPNQKVTVSVTFKKVATKLPFTDVMMDDWFYDGVQFAYAHSLFHGTSSTAFSPELSMSRAMLITVLYRMSGHTMEETGILWYSNAMAWAVAEGITDGTSPEGSLTREQLAVMLYRYAKLKGETMTSGADLSTYADAGDISPWAFEAMSWANAQQLVTGNTPTTLIPGAEASRAQVATILMRYMKR